MGAWVMLITSIPIVAKKAVKSASSASAASLMANALLIDLVVLPTESSLSATYIVFGSNLAIEAIPLALSVIGP